MEMPPVIRYYHERRISVRFAPEVVSGVIIWTTPGVTRSTTSDKVGAGVGAGTRGVGDGVFVEVGDGVAVAVLVGVGVAVFVGVGDGVAVNVAVGVFVTVGAAVKSRSGMA